MSYSRGSNNKSEYNLSLNIYILQSTKRFMLKSPKRITVLQFDKYLNFISISFRNTLITD